MIDLKRLEELVKDIDVSDCLKNIVNEEDANLFVNDKEHYKLLYSIAELMGNTRHLNSIYDIGTYKGLSALALCKRNVVISYDINYNVAIVKPENIEFRIGNFFHDEENITQASFIVFDVDPHDGDIEREFFDMLLFSKFRGIVLFDDIHLNDNMESFWQNIELPKYDITHIGHWSGSGLVDFS